MGIFHVPCFNCRKVFQWFSGRAPDQTCEDCMEAKVMTTKHDKGGVMKPLTERAGGDMKKSIGSYISVDRLDAPKANWETIQNILRMRNIPQKRKVRMSEVKGGTVDWENPFVLDDFDSLPLENGAIKILVAGEALRAANKRFHELIGAAPVLYGVDGKYWSTIKDEEGPDLPDTHKARLICIEELGDR